MNVRTLPILILGLLLPAALSAQTRADEMRTVLGLDLPPAWSYLARHDGAGTASPLEIEDDALPLLIEWLELDAAQSKHLRELLDEYRDHRDRELEATAPGLEKLHLSTTGDPGTDAELDGALDQVAASVTAILDRRLLLEEDLVAHLTPAQAQKLSELLLGSFADEIADADPFAPLPFTEPNTGEKGSCPANRCTSSITIIGCDDRVKRTSCTRNVLPWAHVGRFSNGCSGTLIGPRHVLTAAHCLPASGSTLGFSLGQFGNTWKPYGTQYARRAIRPGEYGGGSSIAVKAFDYAVVELWHSPPGGIAMPYGYVSWNELRNGSAFSIGYPGGATGTFSTGSVVQAGSQQFLDTPSSVRWRGGGDSGLLYTSIDAEGGQSGSPVYRFNNSGRRVVGVLIGSPISHCQLGRVWAARLTPGAVNRINAWKSNYYSSAYPAVRRTYNYRSPAPAYAPTCP